jgi:hypothetical protein
MRCRMLDHGIVALGSVWWFEQLNYSGTSLGKHIHEGTHAVSIDDVTDRLPSCAHIRVAPRSEGARYLSHDQGLIVFT